VYLYVISQLRCTLSIEINYFYFQALDVITLDLSTSIIKWLVFIMPTYVCSLVQVFVVAVLTDLLLSSSGDWLLL